MNARVQGECVNVRVQAVEKIVPDARLLLLVEHVAFQQIGFRGTRNLHLRHGHAALICARMRSLA